MGTQRAGKRAFTLMELLAVVAITSVLIAILVPSVSSMKERANGAKCVSNLRQLSAATIQYASENDGRIPNYFTSATEEEAPVAPAAGVGQWYWHVAPYVNVLRREPAGGMNLGPGTDGLPGPVVFTCPSNTLKESNAQYLKYPSGRPVSYAPSIYVKGTSPAFDPATGMFVYAMKIQTVAKPSRKILLCDSPVAGLFNTSQNRWQKAGPDNWAYQGFTRHAGFGNAAFFDGHIERLSIATFTEPYKTETIRTYFDPYYE
jgi:prepilin-type N-terminal cleavage/methylation domain-containing protein/prepilin-type processing-associated H-X9-DG protein